MCIHSQERQTNGTGEDASFLSLTPNVVFCLSFLVCKTGYVMVPPLGVVTGRTKECCIVSAHDNDLCHHHHSRRQPSLLPIERSIVKEEGVKVTW